MDCILVYRLNIWMDLFLANTQLWNWSGVTFLSALILTAPIHCRASIAETFLQIKECPSKDMVEHISG